MNALELLKGEEDFVKIQSRFEELTDRETFIKELSFAVQTFSKNSYLNSATPTSKLSAILNVAQCGLTLNPIMKLAYLIPRRIDNQVQCVLEPSYQGMVKLVTDTGSAKNIYAYPVYDGDEFQEILGTEVSVHHVPKRKSKNIVLVYAVAVLHDGKKMVEVMVKDEVDDIMKMSESWKAYDKGKTPSCIWVDHYSEMARKTVLKRLVKYLPKTDKWDHLATAISISDGDFKISEAQEDYIHSLIRTSTFDDDRKRDMERSLISMTSEEAGVLITKLQMNQIDNISAGMNYNMGDIHNKLDEHTK